MLEKHGNMLKSLMGSKEEKKEHFKANMDGKTATQQTCNFEIVDQHQLRKTLSKRDWFVTVLEGSYVYVCCA